MGKNGKGEQNNGLCESAQRNDRNYGPFISKHSIGTVAGNVYVFIPTVARIYSNRAT